MEAIRKKKVKTKEGKIIIDLPDFTAKEVDLIIWPSEDEKADENISDVELATWRTNMNNFYAQYNVDLSDYKFNRDELYDR